jgi:hypothetical protein
MYVNKPDSTVPSSSCNLTFFVVIICGCKRKLS